MPVIVVPSNQRRRPTDTMSAHIGMKGEACFVQAQSVSSKSQVGRGHQRSADMVRTRRQTL